MSFTILLAALPLVAGHTQVFAVQDQAKCLLPTAGGNNPIGDVSSPDMTCGKDAKPATEQCVVEAGNSMKLQYGHSQPADKIVDASHFGPCNAYLVPSTGAGSLPTKDGWFKIYQGIWDPQNKWCVDKLRTDKGVLNVPIPSALKAGNYFLRSELNALHEANREGGAQFYVNCFDIKVTGSGQGAPTKDELVSIPGHLTSKTPGVIFNPYGNGDPHDSGVAYPTLGPKVCDLASPSYRVPDSPSSSPTTNSTTPLTVSLTATSSTSAPSVPIPTQTTSYRTKKCRRK